MIMTATTFNPSIAGDQSKAASKSTFLRRMFERLVAARETEARRRVAVYISHYSERELANAGMSARDIEMMRQGFSMKADLSG